MIPRMRTIDEAAKELRQIDPETAVTRTAIRRMVLDGTIPHFPAGVKKLINLDLLLELLANPPPVSQPPKEGGNTIRPINEKMGGKRL